MVQGIWCIRVFACVCVCVFNHVFSISAQRSVLQRQTLPPQPLNKPAQQRREHLFRTGPQLSCGQIAYLINVVMEISKKTSDCTLLRSTFALILFSLVFPFLLLAFFFCFLLYSLFHFLLIFLFFSHLKKNIIDKVASCLVTSFTFQLLASQMSTHIQQNPNFKKTTQLCNLTFSCTSGDLKEYV